MEATTHEIDESVWQGYVSSIASLLMSLLLLLAVLVLSIAILGKLDSSSSSSDEAAEPSNAARAQPIAETQSANWVLIFPEETVQISETSYHAIAQEMFGSTNPAVPNYTWLLSAEADPDSSEESRMAYYRLLATRDFLVSEGVHPSNVKLRIADRALQIEAEVPATVMVALFPSDVPR